MIAEAIRRFRGWVSQAWEEGVEMASNESVTLVGGGAVDVVVPVTTELPFIQARHYTPGRRAPLSLLVIHDMEAARSLSTALHVAQWFAGLAAPQASAHYCVDSGAIYQCVHDHDTAWAAPGANDQGLHFELAGFAKDSKEQWLADVGELQQAAKLIASKCAEYDIPPIFIFAEGLESGLRGITTHAEVTRWKKTVGGHTDPGPNFPIHEFVQMVSDAMPPDDTSQPDEL